MAQSPDRHEPIKNVRAENTAVGSELIASEFVARLRRGENPSIAEYLRDASDPRRRQLLIALIQADLAERIPRDRSVSLEQYGRDFPELGAPDNLPLELIITEYTIRSAVGQVPDISEYCRRFPGQIAAIRQQLDAQLLEPAPIESTNPLVLAPTSEVGDFHIIRELGRGSLSRVYLARQRSLDRLVVLKVTRQTNEWLRDEARTLAALEHEHIVQVYCEQVVGGSRLMALQYKPAVTLAWLIDQLACHNRRHMRGSDLVEFLERQLAEPPEQCDIPERARLSKLSFAQATCRLIAGVARGLDYAHRRGVFHCDVKPSNILLDRSVRAMLMDFNVATRRTDGAEASVVAGGTLEYMAPEQLATMVPQYTGIRAVANAQSDIYSLGIVFYELLSGASPFDVRCDAATPDARAVQLLAARLRLPPPIPRHTVRTTPGLDSIVEKCLTPQPGERYLSAGDLAEDLERYLDHRPLRSAPDPSWSEQTGKFIRRHPRLVTAFITACVLIGLGIIRSIWLESNDLTEAERALHAALIRLNWDDTVGAYQFVQQAELLAERSTHRTPFPNFQARHAAVSYGIRRLAQLIPGEPYREFAIYASVARSGGLAPSMTREDAEQSPALLALLAYHVLERSDWQQLPQFQTLDAETQASVEIFVTEMILIQAADLLRETARPSKPLREVPSISELLSRVPESHKNRHAVRMMNQLALDRSDRAASESFAPDASRDPIDSYLMGVVAAKFDRFESAIRQFDSAIEHANESDLTLRFWSHFHRAYCEEQAGDTDSAIADYATCTGLDSHFAPRHNLGLLYARLGKFDLAAKFLREAVQRGGYRVASVQVNLAAAELKLGNLTEALDAAEAAVSIDQRSPEALANRGAVHAAMGHRSKAVADSQEALRIDPDCAAARENLKILEEPPDRP